MQSRNVNTIILLGAHSLLCITTGPDGSLRTCKALDCDSVTGLIRTNTYSLMLLNSGHTLAVPPDFFLHPHTGRVMPIAGNVAYDPASSTLVLTTDSCTGNMKGVCVPWKRGNTVQRWILELYIPMYIFSLCHDFINFPFFEQFIG